MCGLGRCRTPDPRLHSKLSLLGEQRQEGRGGCLAISCAGRLDRGSVCSRVGCDVGRTPWQRAICPAPGHRIVVRDHCELNREVLYHHQDHQRLDGASWRPEGTGERRWKSVEWCSGTGVVGWLAWVESPGNLGRVSSQSAGTGNGLISLDMCP